MICHVCKNGHWIPKEIESMDDNGVLVQQMIISCSNPDCNYKREKWICSDYKMSVILFDSNQEIEIEKEVIGQYQIIRGPI